MANPNPWQAREASRKKVQRLIRHPRTGEERSVTGWARKLGITQQAMSYRLKKMPVEHALDMPAGFRI